MVWVDYRNPVSLYSCNKSNFKKVISASISYQLIKAVSPVKKFCTKKDKLY